MPAHLREIYRHGCLSCQRKATVELYDGQNSLLNRYCSFHGERALKALQEGRG